VWVEDRVDFRTTLIFAIMKERARRKGTLKESGMEI
jgi:hypothetical protein